MPPAPSNDVPGCSAALVPKSTTLKSGMKAQVSLETTIEPRDLLYYLGLESALQGRKASLTARPPLYQLLCLLACLRACMHACLRARLLQCAHLLARLACLLAYLITCLLTYSICVLHPGSFLDLWFHHIPELILIHIHVIYFAVT